MERSMTNVERSMAMLLLAQQTHPDHRLASTISSMARIIEGLLLGVKADGSGGEDREVLEALADNVISRIAKWMTEQDIGLSRDITADDQMKLCIRAARDLVGVMEVLDADHK